MKKICAVALGILIVSGCAGPVHKEDFEGYGSKVFDYDYFVCDSMAKDLKKRFGYSAMPLAQCMYSKGYSLK